MKKRAKRLFAHFITGTVLVICGIFSFFLLAAGYESVYNKSLPFVNTIDPINLQAFGGTYKLDAAAAQNPNLYGNFGKPQTIKLPQRSLRLDIVPALKDGKTWLSRANTLHLLIPAKPRDGNLGVALLYCRSSFRTISPEKLPSQNGNVFMDTDRSWRYVYKVTNTSVIPETQPYILADDGTNGRLVISCNDSERHINVVIEATLLSVQGIDS